MATGILAAVTRALVGDIADIVRIETLRSTPLIVDGPATVKGCRLLSSGINPRRSRSD